MHPVARAAAYAAPLISLLLSFSGAAYAQLGTWQTLKPMPTARAYAPSSAINGKFVVTGGCCILLSSAPYTRVSSTEIYDPSTNTWGYGQAIPDAVSAPGFGRIKGKLYVAGGSADQTYPAPQLSKLQVYEPVSNSWSNKAPMPQGLEQAASAVIDGKLYVAGGAAGNGLVGAALYRYDPGSDSVPDGWTALTPMPTARDGAVGAAMNGKFYVIGGLAGPNNVQSNYLNVVEAYDPATDSWTTKTPAPTARYQQGAVTIHGLLYVVGGQGYLAQELATLEFYNPLTDEWGTATAMPAASVGPSVGGIDGVLYAAGGSYGAGSNTALRNALYAYTPALAKVQEPINADGSTVLSARRGVIPIKFALELGGKASCDLPSATIALTRVTGGSSVPIDASVYSMAADSGNSFRVAGCQYIYNLDAKALEEGRYRVDIKIGGAAVDSVKFSLR